ncbi:hypothetical protein [Flavobacterium sp.]
MKNEINENPALSKMAVSKSAFYCQNACGEENFSIDEWNRAFHEVKHKSEEIQRLVLDNPECENQCFDCCAIVGKRQKETKELILKQTM